MVRVQQKTSATTPTELSNETSDHRGRTGSRRRRLPKVPVLRKMNRKWKGIQAEDGKRQEVMRKLKRTRVRPCIRKLNRKRVRPRIYKLNRTWVRPCICKLNRRTFKSTRVRPHTRKLNQTRVRSHSLPADRKPEILCEIDRGVHGLARFRPHTLQPEVTCKLNRRTPKSTRVRPHVFQPEVICKLSRWTLDLARFRPHILHPTQLISTRQIMVARSRDRDRLPTLQHT